jgi:hypothetical protein
VTPATPATGTTLEAKAAPAGWERSFVSGDQLRAAFRSTAPEATGFYLYVDDTNAWTRRAGAKGYELITDIDTRTNPFPYAEADDQWVWWYKSDDDTTERPWALVADDRIFYLWVNYNSTDRQRMYAFGDIESIDAADAFGCLVSGHGSATDNSYCGGLLTITRPTNIPSGSYLSADHFGVTRGVRFCVTSVFAPTKDVTYSRDIFPAAPGALDGFPYPSRVSGGLVGSPIMIMEHDGLYSQIRGTLPGVLNPLHTTFEQDLCALTKDMSDRVFIVLGCWASKVLYNGSETGPRQGQIIVDIVGPWRT